jgi:hypothetical protein
MDLLITKQFVAVLGAITAILVGVITLYQRKASRQKQSAIEASNSYNAMMALRIQHPEVLPLSKKWKKNYFQKIYSEDESEYTKWVIYYSYVELCIDYCSNVLLAREQKHMDKIRFEKHHKPLVKLLITEHFPIISQMAKEKKYTSPIISDFIEELRKTGWDWEKEYDSL